MKDRCFINLITSNQYFDKYLKPPKFHKHKYLIRLAISLGLIFDEVVLLIPDSKRSTLEKQRSGHLANGLEKYSLKVLYFNLPTPENTDKSDYRFYSASKIRKTYGFYGGYECLLTVLFAPSVDGFGQSRSSYDELTIFLNNVLLYESKFKLFVDYHSLHMITDGDPELDIVDLINDNIVRSRNQFYSITEPFPLSIISTNKYSFCDQIIAETRRTEHSRNSKTNVKVTVFDLDDTIINRAIDFISPYTVDLLNIMKGRSDFMVLWSHGSELHVNKAVVKLNLIKYFDTIISRSDYDCVTTQFNKGLGFIKYTLNKLYKVCSIDQAILIDDKSANFMNDYSTFIEVPLGPVEEYDFLVKTIAKDFNSQQRRN